MKLREDERQWLIYQEPSVVAAMRGIEVMSMLLSGRALTRHPDIEMRALGNTALRVADMRIRHMLSSKATDHEHVAVSHVIRIVAYLEGMRDKPVDPTDELWAAAVWLESEARVAGSEGDGWLREMLRGER